MKKNNSKKPERVVETLSWRSDDGHDLKKEQAATLAKYANQLREARKAMPYN